MNKFDEEIKKPSIKDVAKRAGVSAQTVSNYLNKRVRIREKTEERIEESIRKLNYVPNIFAKVLRGSKTKTVGVIIPEIANPFYSTIVDGIDEIASDNEYTILLASSSYKEDKLRAELDKLSNYVDGIILCTNIIEDNTIRQLLKKDTPVIALDIKTKGGVMPSIAPDHYKMTFTGTKHLIDMGHTNIYFISEPPVLGQVFQDRINGYKSCLIGSDFNVDESKIITDHRLEINKTQTGYEIMTEIIRSIDLPAAVFASSDMIIIGAMKASLDNKIPIPDGVSFLGCDNIFLSKYTNPPLSTMDLREREMGNRGMTLILDLIAGKKLKEKKILLEPFLIERETVKNLKL
jgi:DNA-binding LacI/PurR family transcriptional regulator